MGDRLLATTDGKGTVCLVVQTGKGAAHVVSMGPTDAAAFLARFAAAVENAECELDPDGRNGEPSPVAGGATLGFRSELDTPELDDDDDDANPEPAVFRCKHWPNGSGPRCDREVTVRAVGEHLCERCQETLCASCGMLGAPCKRPEPEHPPGSKPDKRPRRSKAKPEVADGP